MNKKLYILGYIFAIWFLTSLGGIMYFSMLERPNVSIAIFGQLFLGFGLFITFGFKEKIAIIFALVGFVVLLGALIDIYGSENIIRVFNEKIIPVLGGTPFIIVGVAMLIIPKCQENRKLKRCTLPITARCVKLKDDFDGGYATVWEYCIEGITYTFCDGSSIPTPNIGDSDVLYLNPDDFHEAFRMPSSADKKLLSFVGWVFAILGAVVIYFSIVNYW